MNIVAKSAVAVVVGVLLGLALTWFTVFRGDMPGGVTDGPWRTNLSIGAATGDAMTRASVALHVLLALKRSETLYYTASADSSGAALDGACTYKISGHD